MKIIINKLTVKALEAGKTRKAGNQNEVKKKKENRKAMGEKRDSSTEGRKGKEIKIGVGQGSNGVCKHIPDD